MVTVSVGIAIALIPHSLSQTCFVLLWTRFHAESYVSPDNVFLGQTSSNPSTVPLAILDDIFNIGSPLYVTMPTTIYM